MAEPTDESPDMSPEQPSQDSSLQTEDSETGMQPADGDPDQFLSADGINPADVSLNVNLGEGLDDDFDVLNGANEDSIFQQVAGVFMLWWHWAYFEITVTSPTLPVYHPPKLIRPELLKGSDEQEFVYNINDRGYQLSTSKGEDMYSVGMSMCKMYYTIEKIVFILVNRLKEEGIDQDTEVQVTFDGHLLGQRKAFESIINLNYNVVVTNFDPGAWGERYLEIVKRMGDKGYGYPSEAPRHIYQFKNQTLRTLKN